MASISVRGFGAQLTGDGSATGYVTVASTTNFYPGAIAWISSETEASRKCVITELVSATVMGLRFVDETYAGTGVHKNSGSGRSDLSVYDVADAARVDMMASVVPLLHTSTIVKKDVV